MKPSPPASSFEQPFPYGWRYVKRVLPDGTEDFDQIPLTLEDVLHPREGDVIPESKPHEADRRYLTDVFESRPLSPPFALVTSDLIVRWGIEGMGDHSPDVAVFVGLDRDPASVGGTLNLSSYGGRCELVVELVSPSTRENDVVRKREHYHRIGIPLYVLIDQQKEGGPRYLRAYRRKPGHYAEIETDDRDRLDVPLLGLMIGLRDNRVVCYDLRTHEELGNYARIAQEWEEAKRERDQAKLAREQLEEAMGEQVEARHKAERQISEAHKRTDLASQEAERARKDADRHREEADKLRQEADKLRGEAETQRRAREEAENKRKIADEQSARLIRELQEKLRLLQSSPADPTSAG